MAVNETQHCLHLLKIIVTTPLIIHKLISLNYNT